MQKSAVELGILFPDPSRIYGIKAFTAGTSREVLRYGGLNAMIGLQGTIYGVPDGLQARYGNMPLSGEVFVRLAPF